MKLWVYWMDNNNSKHFQEMELPKIRDNQVYFKDASYLLNWILNKGEIKDYQVELRYQ